MGNRRDIRKYSRQSRDNFKQLLPSKKDKLAIQQSNDLTDLNIKSGAIRLVGEWSEDNRKEQPWFRGGDGYSL